MNPQESDENSNIRTSQKEVDRKRGSMHLAVSRKRLRSSTEESKGETGRTNTNNTNQESASVKASSYGRCVNVSIRYEKLGRIGQGTYGIVYKAKDKTTGEIVALKRCLPHHESSEGFPLTTLREITLLKELTLHKHPNLVQLRDVAVSSSRSGVFLVFEYCQHDLSKVIDKHFQTYGKSPFSEGQVKRLIMGLLAALQFLHEHYIIHRDIKMSNLLYQHDENGGTLKLADFGLSRRISSSSSSSADTTLLTPKVVSLWYRPPELLMLEPETYTTSIDMWGAGCVLGELLLGEPLLAGKNELDQISKIIALLGYPSASKWPDIRKANTTFSHPSQVTSYTCMSLLDRFTTLSVCGLTLMSNMLQYNPKTRCTAKEALDSPYFFECPVPTKTELMPTFAASQA